MKERTGYVRGLDGLRALALVGVLLFHAGKLDGGFLGVDLFFVLSGYLITSLLVGEWGRTGGIDLRAFWARRVRRLLPAALVVLAATCTYAAIALDPAALDRFRGDALAALLNVANWRSITSESDYWASFGPPSPVRHLWSIAVEEQLYLVWPVVLVGALRLGARRGAGPVRAGLVVALVLTVVSGAAMALLVSVGDTGRAYYGTDTRAGAVLLGGAAALLMALRGPAVAASWRPVLRVAGPVGALVLAAAWAQADGAETGLYRGGFQAIWVAAVVVIVAVATDAVPVAVDVLEWAPLRVVGRLSYGAYLWHWVVYLVLDDELLGSSWVQLAVRIAVTLVLAMASAALIELPIRHGDLPTRVWRVAAPSGVVVVALAIGVATLAAEAPAPSTSTTPVAAASTPSLVVVGDSEAFSLTLGAAEVLGDGIALAYDTRVGCGLGPGHAVAEDDLPVSVDIKGEPCEEANGHLLDTVARHDPDVVVVHEGAWDVLDREVAGTILRFGTPAWDDAVRDHLEVTLPLFGADGAAVVVLAAPCFGEDGEGSGHTIRSDDDRVRRWNELLREAAVTAGVTVLPYDELFCGVAVDAQPERTDGVHLTERGSTEVWRWLLPQLPAPVGRP